MKIHCLMNDPFATPGFIKEWIKKKTSLILYMFEYESLPSLNNFDMLIILGGRMGVYEEEEFPWLISEKILSK